MFSSVKLYALLAVAVVVVGYIAYLNVDNWRLERQRDAARAEVATLTVERDNALAAAQHNAAELRRVTDEYEQFRSVAEQALTRERQRANALAKRIRTISSEVANAPPSENGPVAVVLRRVFERLRALEAGRSPDPSRGAPPGPGRPAALSVAAAGP
jgi:hypothetical protein